MSFYAILRDISGQLFMLVKVEIQLNEFVDGRVFNGIAHRHFEIVIRVCGRDGVQYRYQQVFIGKDDGGILIVVNSQIAL